MREQAEAGAGGQHRRHVHAPRPVGAQPDLGPAPRPEDELAFAVDGDDPGPRLHRIHSPGIDRPDRGHSDRHHQPRCDRGQHPPGGAGRDAGGDPVRFVPGHREQLAADAGQPDRVRLGERAEQLGHRGRIPDRAGADVAFGRHRDVDQRGLDPVPGPHLQQLGPARHRRGRHRAGRDQPGGQPRDRRLPDGGEHVVRAGRQRQQRHVADRRGGHPGGAVAAKAHDHPRARDDHTPHRVHGVLRGLPDRLAVEKLDLGPPDRRRLPGAPPDRAQHRRGDAAEIGAEQDAMHPDRPERGQHPLDHVGLLGRGEHRGLRDQAPDIATGQRVRHHADDRITHAINLPRLLLCAPEAQK
jgi:hypothetical protein